MLLPITLPAQQHNTHTGTATQEHLCDCIMLLALHGLCPADHVYFGGKAQSLMREAAHQLADGNDEAAAVLCKKALITSKVAASAAGAAGGEITHGVLLQVSQLLGKESHGCACLVTSAICTPLPTLLRCLLSPHTHTPM